MTVCAFAVWFQYENSPITYSFASSWMQELLVLDDTMAIKETMSGQLVASNAEY